MSCHEPKKGWAFPDPKVNATTVVVPGAAPHRQGFLKPPASAYMTLAPAFKEVGGFPPFLPPFAGGNFWNGRAEGCGAVPASKCPVNDNKGEVSESIGPETLPTSAPGNTYGKFLGPTADQA